MEILRGLSFLATDFFIFVPIKKKTWTYFNLSLKNDRNWWNIFCKEFDFKTFNYYHLNWEWKNQRLIDIDLRWKNWPTSADLPLVTYNFAIACIVLVNIYSREMKLYLFDIIVACDSQNLMHFLNFYFFSALLAGKVDCNSQVWIHFGIRFQKKIMKNMNILFSQ